MKEEQEKKQEKGQVTKRKAESTLSDVSGSSISERGQDDVRAFAAILQHYVEPAELPHYARFCRDTPLKKNRVKNLYEVFQIAPDHCQLIDEIHRTASNRHSQRRGRQRRIRREIDLSTNSTGFAAPVASQLSALQPPRRVDPQHIDLLLARASAHQDTPFNADPSLNAFMSQLQQELDQQGFGLPLFD
jgi:hypothetical protein